MLNDVGDPGQKAPEPIATFREPLVLLNKVPKPNAVLYTPIPLFSIDL